MNHVIFFRIGWMKKYTGHSGSDPITSGGSWPDKGEVFNFADVRGRHYGYVQPPANATGINLPRVDPTATGDRVLNVTVVWIANRPGGGSFVVGWYRNATVYANKRLAPPAAKRPGPNSEVPYFVRASTADCRLLDVDERRFEVPRGKGYPGRSNIFYQDANPSFTADVLGYIETGQIHQLGKSGRGRPARQPDVLKRQAVEKAAIEAVAAHYRLLQYKVESVEADNVGWDLNATSGRLILQLEVKGLSGSDVIAELTPNEYRCFAQSSLNYRLCIVTNALEQPALHLFSYDHNTDQWSTPQGQLLHFEKIMSARVTSK